MIDELYIKDFALINELRIGFGRGMNLITGETGAGKSIILGALNLLMGARATTDMIRSGAQRAIVEASFAPPWNSELAEFLQKNALLDPDTLVFKREISIEGRGRSYINSQQVPVQILKEAGSYLIDIHGQNEHQNILNTVTHRKILDRFAGIGQELEEYGGRFQERSDLIDRLKSVSLDEQEKNRRLEILSHEIEEIESANLNDNNELEELIAREKVLDHAEVLIRDLSGVYQRVQGDDGSILSELSQMERIIEKNSQFDESLAEITDLIREAYYQLGEAAQQVHAKADSIQYSPEEVETVKERLDLLQNIVRKYGPTIEDAKKYYDKAAKEYSGIELSSEEEQKIRVRVEELTRTLTEQALALSAKRKSAAAELEKKVQSELSDLGMGSSRIRVSIKWAYGEDGEYIHEGGDKKYILQPFGFDMVEFMLSSDGTDNVRPMKKIASGGEMSRIMLALKKVIIESDPVDTMIFDEVDAGVGGRVADMVGEKLASLASQSQIMVITHLHQIAGVKCVPETHHYRVSKDEGKGTKIQKLSYQQRIEELARMIGGQKITQSAIDHAKELLAD